MEERVAIRLMRSANHWLIMRLNLSLDDGKNCIETTFVIHLAYNKQGLIWKKTKSRTSLEEITHIKC